MTKAIETFWNGLTYRSRLEATWAHFMFHIGWNYEYEPFDGYGYIPDFLVLGKVPFLLEVKPIVMVGEARKYIDKINLGLKEYDYSTIVIGANPKLIGEDFENCAGLLLFADLGESECVFAKCLDCDEYGFIAPYDFWVMHPCGHTGKHYLNPVSDHEVQARWRKAKEETRWIPGQGRR